MDPHKKEDIDKIERIQKFFQVKLEVYLERRRE